MKAHKHKDLIIAWANGAEIQCLLDTGLWIKAPNPNWGTDYEYRIKPEPTPDFYKYIVFDAPKALNSRFEQISKTSMYICEQDVNGRGSEEAASTDEASQVKLTFDGETGKLKAAEVL